ncbi:hypothetical protein F511_39818 [Dorcoceras hygrometricum]|uniref:Uncharacterized protein n=1 Tax=Dorcoceras hygrometricum TaxID=472368 RepID=A0A2Z7CET5_9LAMI|nr:hypothetical protein F511_39818 [Dorcoceras hygrometricum]
MTTSGPEDREAHLKSRHALSRSGVTRGVRKRIPRITEDIRQDILFHRLSPSINTRFVPSFYTHSFLHTFALNIYFSRSGSRTLPDLSIGGVSPDTLPTSSDQLFVVANIEEEAQSSPLSLDVPELLDVMVFARRLR